MDPELIEELLFYQKDRGQIQAQRRKIEKQFLKHNPDLRSEDLKWRAGGRLEWVCYPKEEGQEHGMGHTVYAPDDNYDHGCDGCCYEIKTFEHDIAKLL